jgi:hypothetical protein
VAPLTEKHAKHWADVFWALKPPQLTLFLESWSTADCWAILPLAEALLLGDSDAVARLQLDQVMVAKARQTRDPNFLLAGLATVSQPCSREASRIFHDVFYALVSRGYKLPRDFDLGGLIELHSNNVLLLRPLLHSQPMVFKLLPPPRYRPSSYAALPIRLTNCWPWRSIASTLCRLATRTSACYERVLCLLFEFKRPEAGARFGTDLQRRGVEGSRAAPAG